MFKTAPVALSDTDRLFLFDTPAASRTQNLHFRRVLLYPFELPGREDSIKGIAAFGKLFLLN